MAVALFYSEYLPISYRTFFTIPNAFLTNAMAGRLYCKAKLELGQGKISVLSTAGVRVDNTIPLSLPRHNNSEEISTAAQTSVSSRSAVQISKIVEVESDFKI